MKLELVRSPTFHMQSISLDLKSMSLSLKCSLGEVNVKGIYSAFNENLYNLIPVMSEGHVLWVYYMDMFWKYMKDVLYVI